MPYWRGSIGSGTAACSSTTPSDLRSAVITGSNDSRNASWVYPGKLGARSLVVVNVASSPAAATNTLYKSSGCTVADAARCATTGS